jgi:pimeloyl-ACP methyl ester carboxylesterase
MPYSDVADGVSLYYEDFGDGAPVVFTNAGNTTHKMWMGQVASLVPNFRTVSYDIRGTGFSAKPRNGYSAETAAADLCALVERLNLGRATFVAHGIGTHIVLQSAEMQPDLVNGIVLVSGGPWFSGERDGVTGGLSAEFLEFLTSRTAAGTPYPAICEEMIQSWLFTTPPNAGVAYSLLEQALAWPQVVLNAFAANMRNLDQRHRLPQITCPALIMHGRHDRKQLHDGAVYTARLLAKGHLVTLERSAHMLQIEEPNAFNEALLSFLREV